MIAQLAVATKTPPQVWDAVLADDPRMFATVLDLMKGQ